MKTSPTMLVVATAVAAALTLTACSTENTPVAERAAVEKARLWLSRIDAGELANAYREAGPLLQEARSEATWSADVARAREQLGALVARRTSARNYEDDPAGYVPGAYVIISFASEFVKNPAVEELLVMRLNDTGWEPERYIIDPGP